MSQDFYEALDKLKGQQAGNTACIRSYTQAINDSMELAARMGVESKAGIKVVGSSDHNDAKMIVDVDDETLRLIFGNADPQAWNGEGLPPVGCVCVIAESDARCKHDQPPGHEVKIYSNFIDDRGVEMAAFVDAAGKVGGVGIAQLFRPARTEREKAIDAMYFDVTGVPATHDEMMNGDAWDCLAAAYDKGYRKQESKP